MVAIRAFVLTVVGTLWFRGEVSALHLFLVGIRDIFVGLLSLAALLFKGMDKLGQLKPRLLGKVTTTFQFVYLVTLVAFGVSYPVLVYGTFVLGLLSTADYIKAFKSP